jgi:hypothetical protein
LPSDTSSLFIENICLTGYIGGQNSTSSKVPDHSSTGVLPLAMQALLFTLIECFLNYKPLADRGEPGTWVTRQIRKKIDQGHSSNVAAAGYTYCLPHDLRHRWQWQESTRKRAVLSHVNTLSLSSPVDA